MLYVADPLFTISLVVAALFLIFKSSVNNHRGKWALTAIIISAVYLCFAGVNKLYINNRVKTSLAGQKINTTSYFTTPAPFNCMLWYIAAEADSGYYTGYSSIWDNTRQPVGYQIQPKNYGLLKKATDSEVLKNLITFADNYYTLSKSGNTLNFNIVRFEQIQGWQRPRAAFVLSYPLSARNNQSAILQEGRMAGWNKNAVWIYLERIAGRKNVE